MLYTDFSVRFAGWMAATVLVIGLAACASDVAPQRQPELTFEHRPPFTLAVGGIDLVVRTVPNASAVHVDHEMPVAPEAALKRWAADRLKTAGGADRARFVITDAAVTETALAVTTGVGGLVYDEQSERYDAAAEATLEIVDAGGTVLAFARSRAVQARTVPESATLNERDAAWFALTEELMRDFDADMETRMRQHLVRWLK